MLTRRKLKIVNNMMTKRTFLKNLPVAAGSIALSACAGGPLGSLLPQYLISSNMITKELLPYFPFNQSFTGLGSISLTAPKIGFASDINKVRLNMGLGLGLSDNLSKITGLNIPGLTTGASQHQGSCQIACGLRYDKSTRGIYLKDPVIEALQLGQISNGYTNQARSLVNALAPQVLDRYAIHTLESSIATRFLGSMTVKDNGIALGFGL